jgi:hypothetical protein
MRPPDDSLASEAFGRLRLAMRSRCFKIGFWMFAVGCGPLLLVIVAASLGLTRDPNPNPVGFGIMAVFTFWPSVILMAIGFAKTRRQHGHWPR